MTEVNINIKKDIKTADGDLLLIASATMTRGAKYLSKTIQVMQENKLQEHELLIRSEMEQFDLDVQAEMKAQGWDILLPNVITLPIE